MLEMRIKSLMVPARASRSVIRKVKLDIEKIGPRYVMLWCTVSRAGFADGSTWHLPAVEPY